MERFHTYLYGRSFTIITDHKPLEMICNKPIASAPPRLQRMLVKIQGYDYSVKYRPGNEMIMSDVLSRLPNPSERSEVQLDLRVDELSLDLVNFSPAKQQQLRDETRRCPILNALAEVVYQGWPDKMTDLPTDLRSFWSFRDELGIEDGVLFKGKQVMIPERMRGTILSQLHKGHQGVEKTRMSARESVYWPRINDDIDKMTKACGVCQELQVANRKEPMIASEVPTKAWKVLATDIFEIKGRNYLILSDYFSKFPIVRELSGAVTAVAVTNVIEDMCGMFGRPDQIRSDNGPQYASAHFTAFCKSWGIEHITSSPNYAQSNGFAERQVRWVKPVIKKCLKTSESIPQALLQMRATWWTANSHH